MNSFMGWIGGKRLLRKEIIRRFPAHKRYIEVFGGAGWVLFAREPQSGVLEVYNDADGELVNLFRCVKYHCGELQRELSLMLTSRELFFDGMRQLQAGGLTDIQRAARFFYLVKLSFGSDRRTYATSEKRIDHAAEYLAKVQQRLQGVNIEHKDFADLIQVYDRPDALFYLDPPYVGTERYYDHAFSEADHQRLLASLQNLRGKFILSYNDCEAVRSWYDGFRIEELSRLSTLVGNDNSSTFKELLIRNF